MPLSDRLTTMLHNCLDQANVCFSGLTKDNKCLLDVLRKNKATAKDIEMLLKMMDHQYVACTDIVYFTFIDSVIQNVCICKHFSCMRYEVR